MADQTAQLDDGATDVASDDARVHGDRWRVYTEDWDPSYGVPAAFDVDSSEDVVKIESGEGPVQASRVAAEPLAFIDGCRRVELSLWAENGVTGERVPGLAGVYAVGAVTVTPGAPPAYSGVRRGRVVIWGGGRSGDLVGRHGYRWASHSTNADDPDQLVAHLQDRMRRAEGDLALAAAALGWTVVLDGPLNRIRTLHELVTGYVKTHRRQLLPLPDHAAVPMLELGARTRLYAVGQDRFTCYVRVGWPQPGGSPWSGIARLDFPAVAGVDAVADRATQLAALLPQYAGVAHRDPRAPVNLTPVKNLENHLTHLLGRAEHATRAARAAAMAGGIE